MALVIAVTAVLYQGGAARAAGTGCLTYDPQTVTLTGSVRRVMAYGPPGFGENPGTDAKEPYLALTLPAPVCVQGDPGQEESEAGVREMQIAFVSIPFDGSIAGSRVRITGMLMHQFTGHHHTEVLIQPARIERLDAALGTLGPAARVAAVPGGEGVNLDDPPAAPGPASDAAGSAMAPARQAPAWVAPALPTAPPIAGQTPGAPVVSSAPSSAASVAQEHATAFAFSYLAQWSAPNDLALAAMSRSYAETVDFYGKPISRAALLAQKRAYMLRWPIRSYVPRPGSVAADCDAGGNVCKVTGLVEWDCRSVERHTHAAGVAEFMMIVVWNGEREAIISESGAVVARAPSP